jgi:hypothetical protein
MTVCLFVALSLMYVCVYEYTQEQAAASVID